MGYDEKKLEDIGDHEDVELETDPEILSRHEGTGQSRGFSNHGYQDQVRNIMCYEAYIMLDAEGTGMAKLHRVIKAGNTILDMEEVDRRPFITFCPLPTPHAFYGSNFAEKLCATQNARTVLTRSILDHAMITNNPRYMVVKGGLTNPRELIDNRVGGLVNVTRPDAISPMQQAPLNPFVFQTIQMLDEDKEDNTGVSRLSQGLNKDAISKQNSAAMVENETQEKIIEISGAYVRVNPTSWKEKRDVMVELKLGYGEQDREAQKLLQLHGMFSQDPSIAPMYTIENRFMMLKNVLEQQGILNVEEYLTPPNQLPPPQPDPAAEMQMQMAAKQLELQERQTQLAEMKAQVDAQMAQMKLELEQMKAQASHALQSDSMDLKEAQLAHKKRIDEGELEILKRTKDVRGIASPTG
jgi:hypothetical protein